MMERSRPPAIVIELELEGSPRLRLDCGSEDDELRLRESLDANRDALLRRVAAELGRVIGGPERDRLLAEAGRVLIRDSCTVRLVGERAAAGEDEARTWLVWALRNLDESDARLAPLRLVLEQRYPGLVAELEARGLIERLGGGP